MDIKFNAIPAEIIQIVHPTASYGIFCFNASGDFFLNSDWGFYGFSWRAYGEDFRKFLCQTNADYIVGKLEINYREVSGKKMPPFRKEKLIVLVESFIQYLKTDYLAIR